MTIGGIRARRRGAGIGASLSLLGSLAAVAAPIASAAPDCSPAGVSDTVNSAEGSAQQYLSAHPDASAAVTAAFNQPHSEAAANLRSYFSAHPQEYYDLRGILAPIGDTQCQCNTTVLSPEQESAYNQFMAGG